jgi:EAL domain-containing protein (putative c-di-GMP-specific phosphodiesterase class I)
VLDEALHQQRLWRDAGIELTMAVNISARSLRRGSDLPDIVAQLTGSWGIAPGTLILELTENALIDGDAPAVLELLHEMGEHVAIDDFGTGHSSLTRLGEFPVRVLKIDRSFVRGLPEGRGPRTLVNAIMYLAEGFGLTVVAEGVETEAQRDYLVENGCRYAQGYLYSPAVPAEELALSTPAGRTYPADGGRSSHPAAEPAAPTPARTGSR